MRTKYVIRWHLLLCRLSIPFGNAVHALHSDGVTLEFRSPSARFEAVANGVVAEETPVSDVGREAMLPVAIESGVIGIGELRELMGTGGCVVVDARAELFWRVGHLPGALSLPRGVFENGYRRLVAEGALGDKSVPVVVYCSGPSCGDAEAVARGLLRLGHVDVRVFRGGWGEWKQAGGGYD